ncbi:hypothetical protein [Dactylosporangium sp. NPDC006015]
MTPSTVLDHARTAAGKHHRNDGTDLNDGTWRPAPQPGGKNPTSALA